MPRTLRISLVMLLFVPLLVHAQADEPRLDDLDVQRTEAYSKSPASSSQVRS
jgi:hypothetical protein